MKEQMREQCPRCGTTECFGPDDKSCSDLCIRRYQAELAALQQRLTEADETMKGAWESLGDKAKRINELKERVGELEMFERIAKNHQESLVAIASMIDAAQMKQWAKDSLSGYTESRESTILTLQNKLAAVERERDEFKAHYAHLTATRCREVTDLQAQLQAREQELLKANVVIPVTWYADKPFHERLLHLVAQWQKLHIVVKKQEASDDIL